MTREDFEFAIMRIEDMELSVAGIVNKVSVHGISISI